VLLFKQFFIILSNSQCSIPQESDPCKLMLTSEMLTSDVNTDVVNTDVNTSTQTATWDGMSGGG